MRYDQKTVRILYKKLLALYPKPFRERLGESMEQTFIDLYIEQKQAGRRLFGFALWIFVETMIGIFSERLLLLLEGDTMKNILANFRSPAIISFLVVLPFMTLEVIHRRDLNEGFPIPLFVFMWVLPMLFILTGMPIVRNLRAGNSILANPVFLLIRVVFLAFLVWTWFGILVDQLPCFLGIPNCD